jgi:hypothetical protein
VQVRRAASLPVLRGPEEMDARNGVRVIVLRGFSECGRGPLHDRPKPC